VVRYCASRNTGAIWSGNTELKPPESPARGGGTWMRKRLRLKQVVGTEQPALFMGRRAAVCQPPLFGPHEQREKSDQGCAFTQLRFARLPRFRQSLQISFAKASGCRACRSPVRPQAAEPSHQPSLPLLETCRQLKQAFGGLGDDWSGSGHHCLTNGRRYHDYA